MLAAFELADKYHIKEVYTFGQPRVGNEAWVKAFEARMAGTSYFRVVSYKDPVPHLPPSLLMGYRHARPEVWYSSTEGGSPTFCNKDGEGCNGQFSLASSLFHSCDHCSYAPTLMILCVSKALSQIRCRVLLPFGLNSCSLLSNGGHHEATKVSLATQAAMPHVYSCTCTAAPRRASDLPAGQGSKGLPPRACDTEPAFIIASI